MIFFGLAGYILKKFNYEAAPLVLALVLGPRLETAVRQSLLLQSGDLTIFLTRPISATFLLIAVALIVLPLLPKMGKKIAAVPKEEDPT